ncbi:hypothetical protein ILUMI_23243 [Ignelater luminosus]|uniref:DDE-1 domain-containing protein n=1 Tax=Ignelater luminosus TaxID=2038154 RepID=A0A8K0C963_IGNLU|nr:hypothetical protein ILUMI_23243 [Ignelater luminosus]
MKKKASLLETIDQRNQKSYAVRLTAKAFVSTTISCPLCKGSHSLNSCERFKQFGLKERPEKEKELKVCYNCLAKGHFTEPDTNNKVLVLLNGHTTHSRNLEALKIANANGVMLLQLPGHTTHRLQPLDVSFLKPLQVHYDYAVQK